MESTVDIEIYVNPNGKQPFAEWFHRMRDIRTQARVEARLRRLSLGFLGDHRSVGGGVFELRLNFGPGFRIYFARLDHTLILLLCGGDKSTQHRDIERAKTHLADYRERSQ